MLTYTIKQSPSYSPKVPHCIYKPTHIVQNTRLGIFIDLLREITNERLWFAVLFLHLQRIKLDFYERVICKALAILHLGKSLQCKISVTYFK